MGRGAEFSKICRFLYKYYQQPRRGVNRLGPMRNSRKALKIACGLRPLLQERSVRQRKIFLDNTHAPARPASAEGRVRPKATTQKARRATKKGATRQKKCAFSCPPLRIVFPIQFSRCFLTGCQGALKAPKTDARKAPKKGA